MNIPYDPELKQGANNAVEACLRIQPDEKTTLITDLACLEIGAALSDALSRRGLVHNTFVLEELAPRPLADDLENPIA